MPGTDPQIFAAAQELLEVCESEEWSALWTFLNTYASGKTQEQHARMDPSLVLAEVYLRLANIDVQRRAALELANRGPV